MLGLELLIWYRRVVRVPVGIFKACGFRRSNVYVCEVVNISRRARRAILRSNGFVCSACQLVFGVC